MTMKFYTIDAKVLKLKVRKFCGLSLTFAEVTEEKLVGTLFGTHLPSWIGLTYCGFLGTPLDLPQTGYVFFSRYDCLARLFCIHDYVGVVYIPIFHLYKIQLKSSYHLVRTHTISISIDLSSFHHPSISPIWYSISSFPRSDPFVHPYHPIMVHFDVFVFVVVKGYCQVAMMSAWPPLWYICQWRAEFFDVFSLPFIFSTSFFMIRFSFFMDFLCCFWRWSSFPTLTTSCLSSFSSAFTLCSLLLPHSALLPCSLIYFFRFHSSCISNSW